MNPRPAMMPRQIVTASAGCGKTFTLSSRLIGLLAADQPAESIFASTFTRKAAGQILDAVLARLAEAALDEAKAKELAQHARPGRVTQARSLELVAGLTRQLHRLNVGTLDSFMVRVVKAFTLELGLPPGWTIADPVTEEQMAGDAVSAVLARNDPQLVVALLRLLCRQAPGRSVHQQLLTQARQLHEVYRQIEAQGGGAWQAIEAPDAAEPLGRGELSEAVEQLAAMDLPCTKAGKPKARWAAAQQQIRTCAVSEDWESLIEITLVQKVATGQAEYDAAVISDAWRLVIERLIAQARHVLLTRHVEQAQAMGKLMQLYDQQFAAQQVRRRAYRFSDITAVMAGAGEEPLDLYYRLDGRIDHLLLDEFQDTSGPQWQALAPMAGEMLGDDSGARASLIVADPKQSIYGWREAESGLLERLQAQYQLDEVPLHRSWRSSQVVLDAVNEVFGPIADNVVIGQEHRDTAERWSRAFARHEAARKRPGHVRLLTGPRASGRKAQKLATLDCAAELVGDLATRHPGCTIGVLTRTNDAVARLIYQLRELEVPASEEGGSRLADSPAVMSLMAALQMAGHPGDRIARYHVAQTPVGAVVGLTDHQDEAAAHRVAHTIRRSLLTEGYGATLLGWTRKMAAHCDRRDLARLMQLVELGCEHDAAATLRPDAFVKLIEQHRVEDPTTAPVRVMTVHQAKGLEFDIVVLGELDEPIFRGGGKTLMVARDEATGRITAVLPYMKESLRALLPQVEPVYREGQAVVMRDALGTLYVAMTRARHALHMVVSPPGKRDTACTYGRLLRTALTEEPAAEENAVLYEKGDERWGKKVVRESVSREAASAPMEVKLKPGGQRSRHLPRRSPSQMEGGNRVDLRQRLRPGQGGAKLRGTVFHAWFEMIEWLDDGRPSDAALRRRAAAEGATDADTKQWINEFGQMLEAPAIAALLQRRGHGDEVEVWRERPFAVRQDDALVRGFIDRLVIEREGGGAVRATIIDFKTDAADDAAAVDELVEHYRPQLEAYRAAVEQMTGLAGEVVAAKLAFVGLGEVREV